MGYRSQVVLAIAPEAASAFMAVLAKHPQSMALCNDADKFESGYEQEGDWLMYWSYIKWYEGYEDVTPILEFVNAMAADDLSEHGEPESPTSRHGHEDDWNSYFKFIRIGEDRDDNVDLGWGFPDIYLQRHIQF